MTTGALAIVVAILAATIFGSLVVGRIADNSSDKRVMSRDAAEWFASADAAVAAGRRIAIKLEETSPTGAATPSADTPDELDRFTTRVAELIASAPTAMDGRVCRNVAVRSSALSTALRSMQDKNRDSSPAHHRHTQRPIHQQTEFETAIRDLADHVELL